MTLFFLRLAVFAFGLSALVRVIRRASSFVILLLALTAIVFVVALVLLTVFVFPVFISGRLEGSSLLRLLVLLLVTGTCLGVAEQMGWLLGQQLSFLFTHLDCSMEEYKLDTKIVRKTIKSICRIKTTSSCKNRILK